MIRAFLHVEPTAIPCSDFFFTTIGEPLLVSVCFSLYIQLEKLQSHVFVIHGLIHAYSNFQVARDLGREGLAEPGNARWVIARGLVSITLLSVPQGVGIVERRNIVASVKIAGLTEVIRTDERRGGSPSCAGAGVPSMTIFDTPRCKREYVLPSSGWSIGDANPVYVWVFNGFP